jgi:hypothetical protein
MAVYLSGEASEETRKFVEEHLAACEECKEAYEQVKSAEKKLNLLKTLEVPVNDMEFINRLRRVLYGFGVSILTLLTIGLAFFEYIAYEDFLFYGLQGPRLTINSPEIEGKVFLTFLVAGGFITSIILEKIGKGSSWVRTFLRVSSLLLISLIALMIISYPNKWSSLGVGIFLLGLYIYLLQRQSNLPPSTNRVDFLRSVESVIPFLTLGISLGTAKGVNIILMLGFLMLIALSITLIRLPRLRYMTTATILVMLVTVGVLAGLMLNTSDIYPYYLQH